MARYAMVHDQYHYVAMWWSGLAILRSGCRRQVITWSKIRTCRPGLDLVTTPANSCRRLVEKYRHEGLLL